MQKVLIITYYWPPAGGPGVQRWLKFATYLPQYGIEPIVFIPKNPHYPLQDDSLVAQVPKTIKTIPFPIKEPYAWAALFSKKKTDRISSGVIQDYRKQSFLERLLLWVRGNLFIPDARKFWVIPSVNFLNEYLEKEHIDTVITTGPPHSLHLIGKQLKEQRAIKWIADFRDPWTSIGYHKKLKLTIAAAKKHKRLEQEVLNQADAIVVTSDKTKQEFQKITTQPITVITNGYDEEYEPTKLDSQFSLAHLGSLLTDRNPETLWQALQELLQEEVSFQKHLNIKLVGVVGEGVLASIKKYQLEAYVENIGYVPHSEVLKYQRRARLLLLLEIDSIETTGIIPGKLFEYLNARRPILAIGPKDWEAGQLVAQHDAGDYLVHGEKELIKRVLLKQFQEFQKGTTAIKSKGVAQYHRRALTEKLAKILLWES